MDAYIRFVDNKGGKHIIAIEMKYMDVLGVNEANRCEEQTQMLIDTGLFSADVEDLLMGGKVKLTQSYRNLLLTERYTMVEGNTQTTLLQNFFCLEVFSLAVVGLIFFFT